MKTIDDIIEAKGSELYAMGCSQTYIGAYCDGIRFGANAVLEKVEEILNRKESKIGKLGRIALLDLLVYELKGKDV